MMKKYLGEKNHPPPKMDRSTLRIAKKLSIEYRFTEILYIFDNMQRDIIQYISNPPFPHYLGFLNILQTKSGFCNPPKILDSPLTSQ